MSAEYKGEILKTEDLHAGYGKMEILHGIEFEAHPGKVTVIVGPNGSGKSTLLKSIFGFTKIYEGRVLLDSEDITYKPPNSKPYLGLAFVFQTDNVFPDLTVRENLMLAKIVFTAKAKKGLLGEKAKKDPEAAFRRKLEDIVERYEILGKRLNQKAGTLSGGERQLLAISIALLTEPTVLLLDEPTAALSPQAAQFIFKTIVDIARRGLTVVLVEQNAVKALEIGDDAYLLVQGRVAFKGKARELLEHPELGRLYLGLK